MGHTSLSNNAPICRSLDLDNISESVADIASGYETLSIQKEEGLYELTLLVSGIHCAACIQKIESCLQNQEAIQTARLNFSTKRLRLVWSGPAELSNDFVKLVEEQGYDVAPFDPETEKLEATQEEQFLLLCLGVAGFAMGNIMLLSVGLWTTSAEIMGAETRNFIHWIEALIALPAILFSGRPFFRSALKALSHAQSNMDVPISVALILATVMSFFEMLREGEHIYFDSAVMLMFFLLIGRYLDFRARKTARSSATDLLSTLSGFAVVLDEGKAKRIAVRDLKKDMVVRVTAGEKFPADGLVLEGSSDVDTALITGETLPRAINAGEVVYAGTINLSAPVTMSVSGAGEESVLADIIRLMEKAGQGQARYVRLADRAARLYTPVVHVLAALAFLVWWLGMGVEWQDALMIAVTVLIITCPCALGLAVPVVQVLASGRLMKSGILVKSGDALERLAEIDHVLLDKTGTLTHGRPALEAPYNEEALRLAASLASHSTHPLSKALTDAFSEELLDVGAVKEHPGQGLEGVYNGKSVRLGNREWCYVDHSKAHDNQERLELWLRIEGEKPEVFYLQDHLRSDAKEVIEILKKEHLNLTLLSGDRRNIVENIAHESGIETYFAQKTPPEKFEYLEKLKAQGHKILMLGDGLNDVPVLAGANVSMAPGSAIDMAQKAADIVFMGEKLAPVNTVLRVARLTQKLVKQNFALAVLYNIIAIPLAFAGLVTPFMAAIAMSGSSLIVIANSFRLRLTL